MEPVSIKKNRARIKANFTGSQACPSGTDQRNTEQRSFVVCKVAEVGRVTKHCLCKPSCQQKDLPFQRLIYVLVDLYYTGTTIPLISVASVWVNTSHHLAFLNTTSNKPNTSKTSTKVTITLTVLGSSTSGPRFDLPLLMSTSLSWPRIARRWHRPHLPCLVRLLTEALTRSFPPHRHAHLL